MAKDNKSLGTFRLDGIPPAQRGAPQIEVTFDIDANGILHVSAKDKGTGKEQKISITGSSGLTEEEIERAKQDAEAHAETDKEAKDLVETRNLAESLVYQTEKQLSEHGEKIPDDAKKPVEDATAALKEVMTGDDLAEIKARTETLQTAVQAIAEQLYQAAGGEEGGDPAAAAQAQQDVGGSAEGGAEDSSEPKQAKGKVVDADFEVVDDKK